MSDDYWIYLDPIWDSVSIYDGEDIFLKRFNTITEKQKVLFATHWAQSEIMNGGLGQFFSNSTGVLAPEAVEGFKKLGMPNCASILSEAMNFFGEHYPRERSARENVIEGFYKEFGKKAIPMLELEDAMAIEIEEENGGFWDAANNYANEDYQAQ